MSAHFQDLFPLAGLKKVLLASTVKKYCLALLEFQTQSINVHVGVMYSRKLIYMLLIKKDLVCFQVCRRSRRNEEHVFIYQSLRVLRFLLVSAYIWIALNSKMNMQMQSTFWTFHPDFLPLNQFLVWWLTFFRK